MKPRLRYHPRTIGQGLRFALLGIRAAMSAIQWLFLRVDEAQLAAHDEMNADAFAAASVDLATTRLVITELESARSRLLAMRAALRREQRLDHGPGQATVAQAPPCGEDGRNA